MFSKLSKRAVPLFGLALIASMALSASASGAELPPENVLPPSVIAEFPKASTSSGSWKNEPTSYTIAWSRCNASGGECSTIAGATEGTLALSDADLGHTLVSKVTAYNAYGQASATSKPSNVVQVPTLHWYVAGSKSAEDTPIAFKMTSSGDFKLAFSYAGVPYEIKCTSQKTEGTAKNPIGGGAGTVYGPVTGARFDFSGCTFVKPIINKCKVEGGAFTFWATGVTTGFEYKPAVKFTTEALEVPVTGCPLAGISTFHGSFIGMANGFSGSSLEFTTASSKELIFNPNWSVASLTGTSKMETTSGSAVTLAP